MAVTLATTLAGSDTAQDIITRALRRIRVVGMVVAPPAEYSSHGLDALNDLLAEHEIGLQYKTQTMTGDTINADKTIAGLADSDNTDRGLNAYSLFEGMNVSGTGIAASTRIAQILDADQIELDTNATASGSDISLTFTAVPFGDEMAAAFSSVLAVRLAEDYGQQIGPVLMRDAQRGQAQIDGLMLYVPRSNVLDKTLQRLPSGRYYDGTGTNGEDI